MHDLLIEESRSMEDEYGSKAEWYFDDSFIELGLDDSLILMNAILIEFDEEKEKDRYGEKYVVNSTFTQRILNIING